MAAQVPQSICQRPPLLSKPLYLHQTQVIPWVVLSMDILCRVFEPLFVPASPDYQSSAMGEQAISVGRGEPW